MIVQQPPRRLRSVACDPGALGIRVLNQPLLAYQLAWLRHHGVTRVVQTSPNAATLMMAHAALNGDLHARGPILLLDGNLITNSDVSAMLRFHADCSPAATVMVPQHRRSPRGGLVGAAAMGRIQQFGMTAPSSPRAPTSMDGGIYIVDAPLLNALLSRLATASAQELLATLRAGAVPFVGWYSSAYSCRIHTPATYHAAHMDLLRGDVSMPLDPPGHPVNGNWIGDDVTIGFGAIIEPPSVIGAGVDVGAGSRVGPRAVVGSHSRLGSDVRVTESVLGEAVVVERSAILDGCVVGGSARIGPFSILSPGAVLAGGTVLRSRTLLPR